MCLFCQFAGLISGKIAVSACLTTETSPLGSMPATKPLTVNGELVTLTCAVTETKMYGSMYIGIFVKGRTQEPCKTVA